MNLLRQTIRSHLLYAALVMLIAIPLFYFITRYLCLQDVDEALQGRKEHLVEQLKNHDDILKDLPWHDLNNGLFIYPAVANQPKERIDQKDLEVGAGEVEPFRVLHTSVRRNGQYYPVALRLSLIGIEDLIQGIVIVAGLLLLLILGGLLWINRQQSRRIWEPFYQALDQLKRFTLVKKSNLVFMDTDINEFKDLQQASLVLTEGAYQAYLQQKEFTENAAHEMQTPLASMQATLEMMIQEEALTSEQSLHVQQLQNTILRMSKLNKGLLLLAKIENNQFEEILQQDPVEIIKKIVSRVEMQTRLKKLEMKAHYERAVIYGNPVLLDILFSNLLINAIHYTPKGGQIFITVSAKGVELKNSGSPLPFPSEKLFQRFQKEESGDIRRGNGLGLAIVWQICETFHYEMTYRYEGGLHQFFLGFDKSG